MLKQFLVDLLRIEGVNSAVILGSDGFIIDQSSNVRIDADALGAMASTSISTSIALGDQLDKGGCEQVLVELENGPIILLPIGQNEILAVVAARGANIGRIRYEIKKNRDRIAGAV